MVKIANGGLVGIWSSGTGGVATVMDNASELTGEFKKWGSAIIYGAVITIGGVLLLLAYSFASGRQDLSGTVGGVADTVKGVGNIVKPMPF